MMMNLELNRSEIVRWLREDDPGRLESLWIAADMVRAQSVGKAVHLRALVEVSNHCSRQCGYCGLRSGNAEVSRYRMGHAEILGCAHQAAQMGYGTVVLQGGEDYGLGRDFVADLVRQIKAETGLAITLSLGERPHEDFLAWKQAGADRYLLRFETSDPDLYRLIHPSPPDRPSNRIADLLTLHRMGYEIGSGIMIGLPGQTYASVADDIDLFRRLDLDMIGVGPYIPHPRTPVGRGEWGRRIEAGEQTPNTELMVYKVMALTRLACPEANMPATTALATINRASGRELGLQRGGNVVMPNITPKKYRELYEIYPGKACVNDTAEACQGCLHARVASVGRVIGSGPGGRQKCSAA